MEKLPIAIKERAKKLRLAGFSIEGVARELGIAKSTSSLWLRGLSLNKVAIKRLEKRRLAGNRKIALIWKQKRKKQDDENLFLAEEVAKNIKKNIFHNKLYCSLLYWCEGGKGEGEGIRFVNSDPILIKTFLKLFRSAFPVDENKFRALMHLHKYHDEKKQRKFWSEMTKIPESQFHKTFLKANTGKRTKANYPGCIAIYYNSCRISREIKLIFQVFSK